MYPLIAQIQPVDCAAGDRTKAYLDTLTKPPGSLGMLEQLAIQLSEISGELAPTVTPPGVVVFAADHGVAAEGVSAFPQAVTAQMVANFANGGAAINVFARQINAHLEVVDVGVVSDVEAPGVVVDKIRRASGNIAIENAMLPEQVQAAIEVGINAVTRAQKAGCRSVIVGEMGIANTTASSAMLAALTQTPVAQVVGAGTGLNSQQQTHKVDVIERALASRLYQTDEPLSVLAALGGLEIAAMTGAYLAAAAYQLPAIVDGFIATVAALTACRICPAVRGYLIFGHRSEESGHGVVLEALEATPLLALGMRLGEGSGAALAFPLLQAATAMMAEMATFTSAGIADKAP